MENKSGLMSVKELLKAAFELTKSRAKTLYAIEALIFAAWVGVVAIGALSVGGGFLLGGTKGIVAGGIVGVIGFIVFLFVTLWIEVALFEAILSGTGFKQSFVQSKHKVAKFFGTSLLAGLIILLGFVLLIVPGIIFTVWYSFASWVVIAEGISGSAALKQSKNYVKDRWWSVAWRLLGIVLFFVVIEVVASMLFKDSVAKILSGVFNFAVTPFACAYSFLLYKNVKETHEKPSEPI